MRGTTEAEYQRRVDDIISIHVPLAGHDRKGYQEGAEMRQFQSTCPLRGTTVEVRADAEAVVISIHVPLAGHDARCDDDPDGT